MADLGFEDALKQLEDRVRKLESGEVGLEEALALFEEGVDLARTCQDHLEEARERVATLSRGQSGVAEDPLLEPEG